MKGIESERRGSKEAGQTEVTCENKCEDACTAALSFSPCTPPNTIEGGRGAGAVPRPASVTHSSACVVALKMKKNVCV